MLAALIASYDGKSRVTAYTCGMSGATGGSLGHTYGYTYNDKNGTLTSMTVAASSVSDTMSFTYDAIGNPLTYYNGSSYTFTWENARQLATLKRGNSSILSFEYNDEGSAQVRR